MHLNPLLGAAFRAIGCYEEMPFILLQVRVEHVAKIKHFSYDIAPDYVRIDWDKVSGSDDDVTIGEDDPDDSTPETYRTKDTDPA